MNTTTETTPAHYAILAAQVEPTLKHYKEDLTRIDKEIITQHPRTPFLHFAREMGTHLYLMIGANEYPAAGEYVPYLFGKSKREEILREILTMVIYHNSPNNAAGTWRHFDGKTVKTITPAKAKEIAGEYVNSITAQWRAEETRRTNR